ncbi:MAG TPA: peptidoglycan recognition family protein [Pyrinomonadaceae bacterium]|nr:peptidoglycan recognition family protein [Pyrinomonadaceae bacterium]
MESTLIYSKIVERYAHFFDRPEIRLRFLNNTLAQQAASRERADAALNRVAFIKKLGLNERLYEHLLRLWLYRLIFQELGKLLPSASKQRRQILRLTSRAPLSARLFFRCYQFRYGVYAAGLATVAVALFGAYSGAVWSARRANDYLSARYRTTREVKGGTGTVFAQTSAKSLPGYKPEKVWLVEQKENYERYSNGARIINDYETENHARGFYVFKDGKPSTEKGIGRDPVGIVYHTSESDMLPFTSENNDSIETHTRGLLEYVRKNRSYNYVIDRFGQVYRIVRDADAANHAGNSVWADARGTYVGLNESFIGVCFETKMEAGSSEERLTEAQLVAGRLLTQVLRSRHQIDDANCVTHGLVSVSPSKMLICFHHDWARGFPFEAMGLSDKYAIAPASVGEFGFTYDEEVAGKLGGAMWPGVGAGEEIFERRAEEQKLSAAELRKRMRNLYREQMAMQRGLRTSASEAADEEASIDPAADRASE